MEGKRYPDLVILGRLKSSAKTKRFPDGSVLAEFTWPASKFVMDVNYGSFAALVGGHNGNRFVYKRFLACSRTLKAVSTKVALSRGVRELVCLSTCVEKNELIRKCERAYYFWDGRKLRHVTVGEAIAVAQQLGVVAE